MQTNQNTTKDQRKRERTTLKFTQATTADRRNIAKDDVRQNNQNQIK